jgi:F-type H+-transporting ATPase subunit epsilon
MKLRIVTPLEMVVDEDRVLALRAEDASGSFGILPGHAGFLTALSVSVVTWTGADHARHYCAVRGGLLTVSDGNDIAIATRQAVAGNDLATLDQTVLARFRTDLASERAEHFQATRLQFDAIRQIVSHLRPSHLPPPGPGGAADFA